MTLITLSYRIITCNNVFLGDICIQNNLIFMTMTISVLVIACHMEILDLICGPLSNIPIPVEVHLLLYVHTVLVCDLLNLSGNIFILNSNLIPVPTVVHVHKSDTCIEYVYIMYALVDKHLQHTCTFSYFRLNLGNQLVNCFCIIFVVPVSLFHVLKEIVKSA